jgi:hypothetical protein
MPPQAINRKPMPMAITLPALIPASDAVALAAGVGLVAKSRAGGKAASFSGAENAGLADVVVVLAAVAGADGGTGGAAGLVGLLKTAHGVDGWRHVPT